jgi:hypothetical protein
MVGIGRKARVVPSKWIMHACITSCLFNFRVFGSFHSSKTGIETASRPSIGGHLCVMVVVMLIDPPVTWYLVFFGKWMVPHAFLPIAVVARTNGGWVGEDMALGILVMVWTSEQCYRPASWLLGPVYYTCKTRIHRNDQCNSNLPLVLVVVLANKIVEHGTARRIGISVVFQRRQRRFHQDGRPYWKQDRVPVPKTYYVATIKRFFQRMHSIRSFALVWHN